MTENKTDASRFTQHMGVVFSLLALLVVTGYVLVKQPLRAIQGDFQLTLQRQGALDDALHHVEAAQLAQQAYLLTGQESYRATSISALDALGGRANALSRPGGAKQPGHATPELSALVAQFGAALEAQAHAYQLGELPTQALMQIPEPAAQQLVTVIKGQMSLEREKRDAETLKFRRNAIWGMIGLVVVSLLAIAMTFRDLYLLRREIDARTRAERALERANEELERQVEERTAALSASAERLRHREAMLNDAQQVAAVGSIEWYPQTDQMDWTDEHFRLWGLEPGSVPVTNELLFQSVHADDVVKVNAAWQAALAGKPKYDIVYRIHRADGEERWIHTRGKMSLDSRGKPVRFSGTVQDITERMRHETRIRVLLERLQLATRSANMGVWERNVQTGELFWDDMMFELYEMKPCEAQQIHREWRARVHPDDVDAAAKSVRDALLGEHFYNSEFRIILSDGALRWIKARGGVHRDATGQPSHLIGVNWDVTEMRNAQLEATHSRDLAVRANAAKDIFLATMSHQLRTPMNSVQGMLELLSLTPPGASLTEIVGAATEASHSLLRIIDDMLDHESIVRGTLAIRLSPVSIAALLQHMQTMYTPLAKASGITLTQHSDPHLSPALLTDPARLSQVLFNLIDNAIKFCPGASVDLRAELIETGSDCDTLSITVADTGCGMDEQTLRRVFTDEQPSDLSAARLEGGAGFGLALARKLVHLMGGTITADSSPGHGTRVRITLDLNHAADTGSPPHSGEPQATSAPCASADTARVLGVDDHPQNRKLLAHQLMQLGVQLEMAENGEQALGLWREGRFSVLLADLNMPGMDGFALARAIREIEAKGGLPRTPIIGWTANVIDGTLERCHAAGMDEVLSKPTSLDTLKRTLDKWAQPGQSASTSPAEAASATLATPAAGAAAVDTRVLEALVGDDTEVLREFLLDFGDGAASIAREIATASAQTQAQDAGLLAHKLKSSARAVGALVLGDRCELIEQAGKAGDNRAVAELLADFDRELAAVQAYIDQNWDRKASN
ncbi:MAG: PAS domain-containing protein [Gammaproteobacteria bacterium]|nr:PAS domain-containing protein [Gammaproteobacteria bacterium]